MNQRSAGSARKARYAGLGLATLTALSLFAFAPAPAYAAEGTDETEQMAGLAAVGEEEGASGEAASQNGQSAGNDVAGGEFCEQGAPQGSELVAGQQGETPDQQGEPSDQQGGTPAVTQGEQAVTPLDGTGTLTPAEGAQEEGAEGQGSVPAEGQAGTSSEGQDGTPAEGQASDVPTAAGQTDGAPAGNEPAPTAAAPLKAMRVAETKPDETPSPEGEQTPEPEAPKKKTGFRKEGGVRHYYDKNGNLVKTSHVIYNNRLYAIDKNGVATNVTDKLKTQGYYRCPDGTIFLADKSSRTLVQGKEKWQTSSSWGKKNGRYYLYLDNGFSYAKYGFSTNGYAHYTTTKGYVRTANLKKGGKLYLINGNGKMLTLTRKDQAISGTASRGFKWAKGYGDKTCPETTNTNELYFLQRETTGALKGGYYVEYDKKGVFSKKGKGLSFKDKAGDISTYDGAHFVTRFGFIRRAVDDKGHNIHVKGKMPVVYKQKIYRADDNGVLTKGAYWSANQRKAFNVIKNYSGSTNYAITVSKKTHRVYLWYRPSKTTKAWQPLFETYCTIGNEQVSWTPEGVTETYDHIKYFSACSYYATGYKRSDKDGWHLHSTLYTFGSGRRTDSRLGVNVSNGCIRVNINYARFVYLNVPLKTRFIVY